MPAIILGILIGIGISCFVIFLTAVRMKDGILRVDLTDPDGPFLFIELKNPPEELKDGDMMLVQVSRIKHVLLWNQ